MPIRLFVTKPDAPRRTFRYNAGITIIGSSSGYSSMKTFFWIVVVFLLVLTFSDHKLIRPYKEQVIALISDKAALATDDKQQAMRTAKKQLLALAGQWGEGQQAQLQKATASPESLLKFYQNYCINGDFNPILYGEPLKQSCQIIEKHYQALTE